MLSAMLDALLTAPRPPSQVGGFFLTLALPAPLGVGWGKLNLEVGGMNFDLLFAIGGIIAVPVAAGFILGEYYRRKEEQKTVALLRQRTVLFSSQLQSMCDCIPASLPEEREHIAKVAAITIAEKENYAFHTLLRVLEGVDETLISKKSKQEIYELMKDVSAKKEAPIVSVETKPENKKHKSTGILCELWRRYELFVFVLYWLFSVAALVKAIYSFNDSEAPIWFPLLMLFLVVWLSYVIKERLPQSLGGRIRCAMSFDTVFKRSGLLLFAASSVAFVVNLIYQESTYRRGFSWGPFSSLCLAGVVIAIALLSGFAEKLLRWVKTGKYS
jgi:hypothetical protein